MVVIKSVVDATEAIELAEGAIELVVIGAQGQEPAIVSCGDTRALLIGEGCELAAPTFAKMLGFTLSPHPRYLTARSVAHVAPLTHR